MNNKSISISAIIFVILYFLFIVFISLFKGLTFYDIKINNIHIKKLFIKIDKKIVLKANNIIIIPLQEVKKDITNIHKKIYYLSKVSSIFETIKFKNIKYKNLSIPLILYKNEKLLIKSKFITLNGKIFTYKNFTIINNLNLNYKKYTINNLNGSISYNNIITFNFSGKYLAYPFKLKGILNQKDNLTINLQAYNIKFKYNNYKIRGKNIKIFSKINLQYKNHSTKFKASKLSINNYSIINPTIEIDKNTIKFAIDKIYIPKLKNISNIQIDYLKGSYNTKSKILIIPFNRSLSFIFNKISFKFYKNSLIYNSLNNINLTSNKLTLINNNLKITSNNLIFLKFNKFIYLNLKNNSVKSPTITLNNQTIEGYKNKIKIPQIIGRYKNIPINIKNILINLALKKAIIIYTNINNILISPIEIALNKNTINIKLKSNDIKVDNKLKEILKLKNIDIPISQLQGKNKVLVDINYNLKDKNLTFRGEINSSNSIFKYKNFLIKYDNLLTKATNYNSNSLIDNLQISDTFINLLADANITTTKEYLNAYTLIKKLNIPSIINLKNFKEKIAIDFLKKFIYFLNSNIIIDIDKKSIYFLSLKKIIKYSIFNSIIKDGGFFINFNKDIIINGNILLTKPLILNQENPNEINIFAKIEDNNITIDNKFLHTTISNFNYIKMDINNIDLNTKTLIYIYNQLNSIFSKTKNNKNNTKLSIISKNTNFIYDNHKFLSEFAKITYDKNLKIYSKYQQSNLIGYTKQDYFLMEGKNYSLKELKNILTFFDNFSSINLDFVFVKSPDNFYTGKVYINSGVVKKLKTLNNIIAFINTIPSLLSLSSPGFSAKGYKIKKGFINYLFYKNILYLKQIDIQGVNLDFKGKGYIDFNKKTINLKITAIMKMKLKKIPIVGKGLSYVLFGKNGNIDVKIVVKGNLDNPKVTQDLGKSILMTPFELFKRVITLPFNIF